MRIDNIDNYFIQAVQGTSTAANTAQGSASDGIAAEDTVTISSEALEMSSIDDLEEISFEDYMGTLSELEENSFWASLKSKLKPSYFLGVETYNKNVADQAAEQLVTEAANRGFDLDLDEAENFAERKCFVGIDENTAEAVEMGKIPSGEQSGNESVRPG